MLYATCPMEEQWRPSREPGPPPGAGFKSRLVCMATHGCRQNSSRLCSKWMESENEDSEHRCSPSLTQSVRFNLSPWSLLDEWINDTLDGTQTEKVSNQPGFLGDRWGANLQILLGSEQHLSSLGSAGSWRVGWWGSIWASRTNPCFFVRSFTNVFWAKPVSLKNALAVSTLEMIGRKWTLWSEDGAALILDNGDHTSHAWKRKRRCCLCNTFPLIRSEDDASQRFYDSSSEYGDAVAHYHDSPLPLSRSEGWNS